MIDRDDAPELTDELLATARPAREVLSEAAQASFNKGGRPKSEHPKVPVNLRLDPIVLTAFKATGAGWQTRMNDVLRAAVVVKGDAVYVKSVTGTGRSKASNSNLGEAIEQVRSVLRQDKASKELGVPFGRPKSDPGSRLKNR